MGREIILGVFLLLFSFTASSLQQNHISVLASSTSAASLQKSLVLAAANVQDKSTNNGLTTRSNINVVSVQRRGGRGRNGGHGRGGFHRGKPRDTPGADNDASNDATHKYRNGHRPASNAATTFSHNHIGCTSLLVAASWILLLALLFS